MELERLLFGIIGFIGVILYVILQCFCLKVKQERREEQVQQAVRKVLQNPTFNSATDAATGQQKWYLSANGTDIPPGAVVTRNPDVTSIQMETQTVHSANQPVGAQAPAPLMSATDSPLPYPLQQYPPYPIPKAAAVQQQYS